MDAWNTLLQKSTLTPPGFDAWEHLNNQEGGGTGPCDGIVLIDGLRVLLDNNDTLISINNNEILVNVDGNDIDMLIDQNDVSVNLDQNDIGLNLPNDNIDVEVRCGSTLIPQEELMTKIAGANIGGLRCVVTNAAGEILHADSTYILEGKNILGIAMQATAIGGVCPVAVDGDEIIESSWSWDINTSIYVTEYGHLTQTIPTENYVQIVAIPTSTTSLLVQIEPPIFL